MFVSRIAFVSLAVWLASTAAALSTPRVYTVRYVIHTDPDEPNSPVKMRVDLLLERDEVAGSSVGWRVLRIEFRKPDGAGYQVWARDLPPIPTQDGLWWAEHANPEAPQASEFTLPPTLVGVASAVGSQDDLLLYNIESHVYQPPLEGPPWPVTTSLTYSFTDAALKPIVIPSWLEPVEIPPISLE